MPSNQSALEVAGLHAVGRAAVGDEGALAARRDEDADPPGAMTGDAHRPDRDAVAAQLGDQRPAGPSRPTAQTSCVRAPRRASQRATFAAEPPWRISTRPGTSVPLSIGAPAREHDVEHEIAQDEDPRRRERGRARRLGAAGRHDADGSDAGRRPSRGVDRAVGTTPSHAMTPDARPAGDQHHPDPGDGRRPEGQLRASRARRWAPRRWPTSSGRASSATRRPTPTGRTATASSCRPATPRCCCTRSST